MKYRILRVNHISASFVPLTITAIERIGIEHNDATLLIERTALHFEIRTQNPIVAGDIAKYCIEHDTPLTFGLGY